MRFDGFYGNAGLKERLSAAFCGGRVSHCFLLCGPDGSGKHTLARILAAAMQCTGRGETPCGVCPACRKALSGQHPDVIYVEPDRSGKTPVIKVDQIRSVAATAYILPSEAEKKVYVLRQAELMNLNAQNAFLKLLEEPPRSAAFILAAASPDSLLPTVRSRCALLRDPAEQPLESEEMRTLADDYLHAVASQDRMTILRWCLAHEGMEAQTLAEFLPAVQHRLVELLAQPGQTLLPETLCAQQLRLIETCGQYRRANVSVKHIFGLLSVSGVQARVQK